MGSTLESVVVASTDRAVGEALASAFQRRGHVARFCHLNDIAGTVDGVLVLDVTDVDAARTVDLSRLVGERTVRVVVVGRVDWFGHSHPVPHATVPVTSNLGDLVAVATEAGSGHLARSAADTMRVRSGRPVLTDRERQGLKQLLAGRTTQQIAQQWSVSEHTVRTHLRNSFVKIGVHSRAEAIAWALEAGLSPAPLRDEASA